MKTKNTIILILLLCFTTLFNNAKAQIEEIDYVTRVLGCSYIFEGEVIQSTSYNNQRGNYILTSNTIHITKIFKGDLECGTVELITDGGRVGDEEQQISHTLHLTRGEKGLFACNLTNKELSAIDFYPENNWQKLEAPFEEQSFVQYIIEDSVLRAYDMFGVVDSLSQLYNMTELVTGLLYINCENNEGISTFPTTKKHKAKTKTSTFSKSKFQEYDKSKIENIKAEMKSKIQVVSQNKSGERSTKTIIYTLSNDSVSGSGPLYYEFDVNLADDVGNVYIDQADISLIYDTVQFGQWAADSGKVQVTRGTLITDTTVYQAPGAFNYTPERMHINVTSIASSPFAPLLATPTQAVHVKMEIGGCSGSGQVAFVDQAAMLVQAIFDSLPTFSGGDFYGAISANQSIYAPSCNTHIYNFTPTTINGGVFDTLTIQGTNFGATRGNGRVYLRNADNGGLTETIVDDTDYISWNDNIIKLLVMSTDSAFDTLGNIINFKTPGTGVVKVITDAGDTDTSTQPLTIYYSVADTKFPSTHNKKFRMDLVKKRGLPNNKGYLFYVDSALWNAPDTLALIRRVMHDWTCATGVNWEIVGAVHPDSSRATLNDTNLIQLSTFPIGSNVVALATNNYTRCLTNGYASEIDIEINANPLFPLFTDTTGQTKPPYTSDLFSVLLHEFGHAQQLKHVNDNNELMYYSINAQDSIPGAQRHIYLYQDLSASDGGLDVMFHSIANVYPLGCDSTFSVKSEQYCTVLGVNDFPQVENDFVIYPNPTTDFLNINYTSAKSGNVTLSVINILGQTLQQQKIKVEKGNNEFKFDANNLSEGIYVCTFASDNKLKTLKFIKQ